MGLPTLAITALVATGVGTVMQMAGSYAQSQQQQQMMQYQAQRDEQNAKIARDNAQIAEDNARDTESAGRSEEQRKRLEISQRIGQQRALAGASGIDVGSDSFLDDFASTAMLGEADAINIRNSYRRQANTQWQQASNFRQESDSLLSSAGASRRGARNAKTNGWLAIGGDAADGVGRVAGSWYQYKGV